MSLFPSNFRRRRRRATDRPRRARSEVFDVSGARQQVVIQLNGAGTTRDPSLSSRGLRERCRESPVRESTPWLAAPPDNEQNNVQSIRNAPTRQKNVPRFSCSAPNVTDAPCRLTWAYDNAIHQHRQLCIVVFHTCVEISQQVITQSNILINLCRCNYKINKKLSNQGPRDALSQLKSCLGN